MRNPPGKEIYRKGNHSIFEVRLISNDLSKIVKYFLRHDSSGGWEGPQAVLPEPVPPGQAVPRPQDPLLRRWAFHFLHSLRGGQVAGVLKLWNNLNLGTPQIWLPHCGVLFQGERKPWWKQCCLYSHLAPIPGSMPSLITLWLLIFSLISLKLHLYPFQRKGYGKLLIAFSYELSKMEQVATSSQHRSFLNC